MQQQCSQQNCSNCVSKMKFAGHSLCFNNKSCNFMHDVKDQYCDKYKTNR